MTAKKEEESQTPLSAGSFLMRLDDFLNTAERETGHIEALAAFGKAQARKGLVKQSEEKWRADYAAFLGEIPR